MQFIVDCFYGLGVGYRGNVNITRSGRTCQAWKSQCPHRHWRTPEVVTDRQNDYDMCRNPDSSAPNGPWCYTTDPQVRWEYCNVTKCPPRGILNSLSKEEKKESRVEKSSLRQHFNVQTITIMYFSMYLRIPYQPPII